MLCFLLMLRCWIWQFKEGSIWDTNLFLFNAVCRAQASTLLDIFRCSDVEGELCHPNLKAGIIVK